MKVARRVRRAAWGNGPRAIPTPRPRSTPHLPIRVPEGLGRTEQRSAPVYTAPTEASALARFDELAEKWGTRYPVVIKLWRSAWTEFVPFLDDNVEIRRIICTTKAIESINARCRRAIRWAMRLPRSYCRFGPHSYHRAAPFFL